VADAIDWETASIGPRELDLGWWLMMDDYATRAVGIEGLGGFPSAAETRAFYAERAGVPVAGLDQVELLAAVKLAITLIRTGDTLVERGVVDADSRSATTSRRRWWLAGWASPSPRSAPTTGGWPASARA
jgi:aminoglycoside phosphotransferase (APT) family kinase protein